VRGPQMPILKAMPYAGTTEAPATDTASTTPGREDAGHCGGLDLASVRAVVYDGHCPFCTHYVKWQALSRVIPGVELLSTREPGPVVAELARRGYDLDAGMALVLDGEVFHGADCLNRLALMSTRSNRFNRLMGAIFRRPGVARALYPPLRFGRNVTLRVLGRR
jgi:hypothetical protein